MMFLNNLRVLVVLVFAWAGCAPPSAEDQIELMVAQTASSNPARAGDFGLALRLPFATGESRVLTRAYQNGSHVDHGGGWILDDRYAIDLAGYGCESWNQPVLAAASGTVEFHGDHGYGNNVVLNHGNGCYSQYAHLQQMSVLAGQTVTAGQELGREGNTGHVSGSACPSHPGSHVHFKVVCNGQAVLPEPISGYTNLAARVSQTLQSDNVAVPRHLPGTLLKRRDYPEVYWVDPEWRLHWITNENVFSSRRLFHDPADPFGLVVVISEKEFACYTHGPWIDWPVTMRLARCGNGLYLTVDDRGYQSRRWIPGDASGELARILARSWGFRMNEISEQHSSCSFPEQPAPVYVRGGTILRDTGNGVYWYVDDGGYAHYLSEMLFNQLGYAYDDALDIPPGSRDAFTLGLDGYAPQVLGEQVFGCGL